MTPPPVPFGEIAMLLRDESAAMPLTSRRREKFRAAATHLEALEAVMQEAVAASDEVNARYIGGSDLDGPRFSATMDRLALAALNLRITLRGSSPTTDPTHTGSTPDAK